MIFSLWKLCGFPNSKRNVSGCSGKIRDTGEPLAITLRGETLAIVQAPGSTAINRRETVVETLHRLHPLLLVEDEEFEAPVRSNRPSALDPLAGGN